MKSLYSTEKMTSISLLVSGSLLFLLEGLGAASLYRSRIWLVCGVLFPLCALIAQIVIAKILQKKIGRLQDEAEFQSFLLSYGYLLFPVIFFVTGIYGVLVRDNLSIISGLILLAFFVGNDLAKFRLRA